MKGEAWLSQNTGPGQVGSLIEIQEEACRFTTFTGDG